MRNESVCGLFWGIKCSRFLAIVTDTDGIDNGIYKHNAFTIVEWFSYTVTPEKLQCE